MATTTANATVGSKSVNINATVGSKSATAAAKTQRVLETREAWSVIFNHTVSLVAASAKGEPLCENPREGFAFGKAAEQPHSRGYAQSLLSGFVSRKANKFFAEVDGLKTSEERTKIALAILTATKLGGNTTEKASGILSKAEPKQAKTFAEAVLNLVQNEKPAAKTAAPKEQVEVETASPKGKKATANAKGKRGGKGGRKAAAKA